MLFGSRKREQELLAREASGESFWSAHFDDRARMKIVHAVRAIVEQGYQGSRFLELARTLILRDEGLAFLVTRGVYPPEDMIEYILAAPDEMMPSVIEALSIAFNNPALCQATGQWGGDNLDRVINTVMTRHRISFELIDHHMVEFASKELHAQVVSPTLRLLAGRPGWDAVERAYQDALEELSKGKPGDAITDAGTALQEALTVVGAVGNALGPLIKSARAKGLLAGHDEQFLGAVEKVMHWVSADRSEKGDAHAATMPSPEDGWLIVHIVGALILMLAGGIPRG